MSTAHEIHDIAPADIVALREALNTLITFYIEHTRRHDKQEGVPLWFKSVSLDEIAAKSDERWRWEAITRDPIRYSLRRGIKAIGHLLNDIGGFEAMGEACDAVAEMGDNWGLRTDILDKAWDGIGDWHA